jgi:hypothetical protein
MSTEDVPCILGSGERLVNTEGQAAFLTRVRGGKSPVYGEANLH